MFAIRLESMSMAHRIASHRQLCAPRNVSIVPHCGVKLIVPCRSFLAHFKHRQMLIFLVDYLSKQLYLKYLFASFWSYVWNPLITSRTDYVSRSIRTHKSIPSLYSVFMWMGQNCPKILVKLRVMIKFLLPWLFIHTNLKSLHSPKWVELMWTLLTFHPKAYLNRS